MYSHSKCINGVLRCFWFWLGIFTSKEKLHLIGLELENCRVAHSKMLGEGFLKCGSLMSRRELLISRFLTFFVKLYALNLANCFLAKLSARKSFCTLRCQCQSFILKKYELCYILCPKSVDMHNFRFMSFNHKTLYPRVGSS